MTDRAKSMTNRNKSQQIATCGPPRISRSRADWVDRIGKWAEVNSSRLCPVQLDSGRTYRVELHQQSITMPILDVDGDSGPRTRFATKPALVSFGFASLLRLFGEG